MAKLTLNPIGSFSQSAIAAINTNMDRIEEAVEKTLSRDGTTPNQMTADFDMNHNDILNAKSIEADDVLVDGESILDAIDEVLDAIDTINAQIDEIETIYDDFISSLTSPGYLDAAVGNGVDTIVTGRAGMTELDVFITVNGVPWPIGSYSINGNGDIVLLDADDQGDGTTINTQVYYRSTANLTTNYTQVFPVIPQQFGTIGVGNDQDVLERWKTYVLANQRPAYVPRATYTTTAPLDFRSLNPVQIEFEEGAVFDNSGGTGDAIFKFGAGFSGVSRILDSVGDPTFLASAITANEYIFSLEDAPSNILENSWMALLDTTDYSYMASAAGGREYYRKGEMFRVKQVSGVDVTTVRPIYDNYATSTALYLYKLTIPKVVVKGGYFIGNSAYEFAPALQFEFADVLVENISGTDARGGICAFRNCTGFVKNVRVSDPETNKASQNDAEGYGITLIGCDTLEISDCDITTDRHAMTFTGGGTEDYTDPGASPEFLTIPNARCGIMNSYLKGGYYGLDFHGHCRDCYYGNVVVDGGVTIGGRGTYGYGDNHITGLAFISGTSRGGALHAGELIDLNGSHKAHLYLHSEVTNAPNGLFHIISDLSSIVEGGLLQLDLTFHHPATQIIAANINIGAELTENWRLQAKLTSDNAVSPLFDLTTAYASTGILKEAVIETFGVAPRVFSRGELIEITPRARASTEEGLEITLYPHTVRQTVIVNGGWCYENTKTGIKVTGVNSAGTALTSPGDTHLIVRNNFMPRNNQTNQSSGFRNSMRVTGIKVVEMSGNTVGDDASSPTQTQTWFFDSITSLKLGENTILGTVNENFTNIGSYAKGSIFPGPYLVAALPSATIVPVGTRTVVTNATTTTFASTVAGGGANTIGVISNGTNWIIG